MSKVRILSVAMLVASVTMSGLLARAADPTVAASEKVAYRLTKWKSAHADGEKDAEKLVKTLKKLRCEVTVESHGGHSDVKYRCPKWQSLSLKDHNSAHQWESWLKKRGFETKHAH